MKLQSKKNKVLKYALIAGAAVLVIVGIVLGVVFLGNSNNGGNNNGGGNNGGEEGRVTGIAMSTWPKTEYYVGDEADFSAAEIQVRATTNDLQKFVGASELTFSGFDSSVPNDALVITVTYQGYTTTFNVKIKERPAPPPTESKTLESISISEDFITEYPLEYWRITGPYLSGAKIIRHYSDGTTDEVQLKISHCAWDRAISSACVYDMLITYNYAGKTYTCTVPITITN